MIMTHYLMNKKDLILWNKKNKIKSKDNHKDRMSIINYCKKNKKNMKKKLNKKRDYC